MYLLLNLGLLNLHVQARQAFYVLYIADVLARSFNIRLSSVTYFHSFFLSCENIWVLQKAIANLR